MGRLWSGWLLVPLAWFVQLELAFALVPWTCGRRSHALQYLVAAAMLLVAIAGVTLAWRAALASEGRSMPSQARRFLARAGLGLGVLFLLAMVALSIPTLVLRGCD
jgi:hypothetical protein